jgi:hypothetical protein
VEKRQGRPSKRLRRDEEEVEARDTIPPAATLESFFASVPSSIPSSFPGIVQEVQEFLGGQSDQGLGGSNKPHDLW